MLAAAVLRAGDRPEGTLSFRLLGGSDIVVEATIGGEGPFRFVLDTGSSRTAVSDELVRRLSLPALAKTMLITPTGTGRRPLVRVDGLRIGTTVAPPLVAMSVPGATIGHAAAVDGILGQDVLARLVYTIDYPRRAIVWHTGGTDSIAGVRLALEPRDGAFVAVLPQPPRGRSRPETLRLVPDSGADGLVLFARKGRTLPAMTALEVAGLRTLAGARLVRRVLVHEIAIGDIRLREHPAVVVDRGEPGALADGLLPLHDFARVTLDGAGRRLIVER